MKPLLFPGIIDVSVYGGVGTQPDVTMTVNLFGQKYFVENNKRTRQWQMNLTYLRAATTGGKALHFYYSVCASSSSPKRAKRTGQS